MKSYAICPISEKKVNERVSRFNALATIVFLLAFGYTQNLLFVALLFIDFYIRSIDYGRFSPITLLSCQLVKFFAFDIVYINAAPKIFSARIGLLFSGIIVLSSLLAFDTVANIIAFILGIFSFLEAAFGFCLACKLYPLVYRHFYKTE